MFGNTPAVRDDIVLMLAGEGVEANVQDSAAVSKACDDKVFRNAACCWNQL